MRKSFKKIIAVATAALMTAGALSLAACGTDFKTPQGGPAASDAVESNGGFVVAKGNYYYFINGVESYTADNTYGTPVKGALYRIKKEDVKAKRNTAERVVPSIMSSGTYTNGGIYVYGDRVYYTTPNDVRDPVSGEIDSSVLRFQSAKLDGSDIKDYFTLTNNSAEYRFVEKGDAVYVLYVDSNDLYSYNTASGAKTLLADNTTSVVFNKGDLTDPTVYYTMSVSENQDSDKDARTFSYNQVYTVSADATAAPYEYKWDMDYIKEELDGQLPYTNLGTIVLDGVDSQNFATAKTQFTHSATAPKSWQGYSYTLRSYENGGLYYTVTPAKTADGSVGSDDNGQLLYIDAAKLTSSWDSIKANDELGTTVDIVANAMNLSKTATTTALYYTENGNHHYLYVNGNAIYRADVNKTDGSHTADQLVADDVSGATLVSVDLADPYQYLYFTRSNGSGHSVERAVINGDPEAYKNLPQVDGSGAVQDYAAYRPVKVLNLEQADSWYQYELIGTDLFFADADSDIGSTSFKYISVVSLANKDGKLMNNEELAAFTEKYDSIMGSDSKTALLAKLTANSNSKLSTALRYYFFTGERAQFDDNIKFATDNGRSETYLYSETEKTAFKAFIDGTDNDLYKAADYKDESGASYRTYSYFVTKIGEWTEADDEAVATYWENTLAHYTLPAEEETESGLPGWAWALIGIAIGVVVIGCAAAVIVVLRKKKETAPAEEEKMNVDTTDDRDVDVYATDEEPAEEVLVAEPADETPADEAPVEETPAEEAPVEEAPVEETPAEEAPEEAPAPEEGKPQE